MSWPLTFFLGMLISGAAAICADSRILYELFRGISTACLTLGIVSLLWPKAEPPFSR